MKNINENLLMRTPESNRLLQLTSALAEDRSCLKGSFFLGTIVAGSFKKVLGNLLTKV